MILPRVEVKPQEGLQEDLLSCTADIAICGGSAGGGKTYGMLLDPLHYALDVSDFECIFFRRTYPEITAPGGLSATSYKLYPQYRARRVGMDWIFPKGAKVYFRHLQNEDDIYSYMGSQIQVIYFDELTHFTRKQFFYFLSRNRNPTTNGIEPYIRASCNPEPDSWLADLLKWWIDQNELLPNGLANPNYGLPIKEREGVLRYFATEKDIEFWGNTPEEVIEQVPHLFSGLNANTRPLSITFIPGTIYGNKILLEQDPKYLGSMLGMSADDQAIFLDGNWKVRAQPDALYNSAAVGSIHSNYPPVSKGRFITGDIARFGHDWTVLFVWYGYEIVGCLVMKVNDSPEAVVAIEFLRSHFGVMEHDVLIDQNGVGGEVLKLRPGYNGFLNNAQPLPDPDIRIKENYFNLKTQCYYRSSYRLNEGGLKMTLNADNVWIYESSEKAGSTAAFITYNHIKRRTTVTKMGSETVDIRDVLKRQLRAIRKAEMDKDRKLHINSKEEQKALLGGWSPDFADNVAMREWFDLRRTVRQMPGPDNT